MSRRSRDTWSRSTTSWYRKEWALPASRDNTTTGSYCWLEPSGHPLGRGAKDYENESEDDKDKDVRRGKEKGKRKGKDTKQGEVHEHHEGGLVGTTEGP